jgi:hypothetical protein
MISDKKMQVDSDCFTEKKISLTKEKLEEIQEAEINILDNNKIRVHSSERKKAIQNLKDKIDKDGVSKEIIKELIDKLI